MPIRIQSSSGSIITSLRLNARRSWRRKRGLETASRLHRPVPRIFQRKTMIWWRSSIAFMTWATPLAQKETLAKDGSWMIVEPFAHDNLKDNLNPVGCIFYHASTFICTPASLSQEVGLGLGAQAGEYRLRQVATEAGFKSFRRATETPFNMIFDGRSCSVAFLLILAASASGAGAPAI